MDIVYPFRHDPQIGNLTLKYSIRSVRKHFTDIGNIYVIGADPQMPGIIHIPTKDDSGYARNIFNKMLQIANTKEVSEDLMMIMDDHFMLKSGPVDLYPLYANNTLQQLAPTQGNVYKLIIQNTIRLLKEKDKSTRNYNIHCPAIFNKAKLRELAEAYPLLESNMGFILKSLYFNHFDIPAQFEIADCKIKRDWQHLQIESKIAGRDCFSTGKEKECPNILSFLEKLYPET